MQYTPTTFRLRPLVSIACFFLTVLPLTGEDDAANTPVAPTATVYDVSQIPQTYPPNMGLYENGTTVAAVPSFDSDETNLGRGSRSQAQSASRLLVNEKTLLDADENVINFLLGDPARTVNLKAGLTTVIFDIGRITQFKDISLKAFGETQTQVTIEVTSRLQASPNNTSSSTEWATVVTDASFNANQPLNVEMEPFTGRYIKGTFKTSVPGLVGALVVGGHHTATTTSISEAIGSPDLQSSPILELQSRKDLADLPPPAITNISHITAPIGSSTPGEPIRSIGNLLDADFRTFCDFKSDEPLYIVIQMNGAQKLPIENISILLDKEPNQLSFAPGELLVYALNSLPFAEEAVGDAPTPGRVNIDTELLRVQTPYASARISPDSSGIIAPPVPSPQTPNYLVLHMPAIARNNPSIPATRRVASVFASPTINTTGLLVMAQGLGAAAEGLTLPQASPQPPQQPSVPAAAATPTPPTTPITVPVASPLP